MFVCFFMSVVSAMFKKKQSRPARPARPSHRTAQPSASAMVGGRAHVRSRGTPRSAAATSLARLSPSFF